MAVMPYTGFVGPSYQSLSYMADSERLINRFPEKNESDSAPTPWALLQCPGFQLVAAATNPGFGAGLFSQNGRTFFIAANTLYELNADNTLTVRNTSPLARNSNPATFMTNGDGGHQLGFTSGDHFYVFDLNANTFVETLTSGATMCGFLDGFGFILDASTSTLRVTA